MVNSLENRMKENYENAYNFSLTKRTPVIIRLDGCHFHTFTKGFKKPFDDVFMRTMMDTMKYLCENIMGCVLGYTQSDEISLLLIDYKKLDSESWFNNRVQKIASVSASMATLAFHKYFLKNTSDWVDNNTEDLDELNKIFHIYQQANETGAIFDARVFNIPESEVTNYFICRQQDASKNSILGVAQSQFTQKEIQGINTKKLQDKLLTEKNINWNDLPTIFKRGSCCTKSTIQAFNVDIKDGAVPRHLWWIDYEIPIFTQDRDYIEKLLKPEEE